jgi:hypothetical protein
VPTLTSAQTGIGHLGSQLTLLLAVVAQALLTASCGELFDKWEFATSYSCCTDSSGNNGKWVCNNQKDACPNGILWTVKDGGKDRCTGTPPSCSAANASREFGPWLSNQVALGLAPAAVLVASRQATPPSQSCFDTCAGGVISAGCSQASTDVQVGGELSSLQRRLRNSSVTSGTLVSAAELRNTFKLAEDPCNRGNTTIRDGRIENRGQACTLEASLPGQKLTAVIDVPEAIQGTWRSTGQRIRVEFQSGGAPHFQFVESETRRVSQLGVEFGGLVTSIEADATRMFLRTAGGCVGVALP